MKIDLSKPNIENNELIAIKKSIKTGWLTHGENNKKFENLFQKSLILSLH